MIMILMTLMMKIMLPLVRPYKQDINKQKEAIYNEKIARSSDLRSMMVSIAMSYRFKNNPKDDDEEPSIYDCTKDNSTQISIIAVHTGVCTGSSNNSLVSFHAGISNSQSGKGQPALSKHAGQTKISLPIASDVLRKVKLSDCERKLIF